MWLLESVIPSLGLIFEVVPNKDVNNKADLWLCQHMIGNTVTKFTHVEAGSRDDICLGWPSLQVTEIGLDLRSDRFQGSWPLFSSPQGHTQLGKIGKDSV